MWNETFHSSIGFNHKPNQLLVDTVRGRKPGTALDLAMGQGRNAVFLAQEGWKVTGVDISDEGIAQATAAAKGARGKLETVRADLDTWDMGKGKWDLVTMIYAGSDAPMIARAQAAVKPGGLMVIEYFQAEATAGIGIGGFAKGEPASAFKAGWKLLRDEAVEDIADWGMRKTKLVRFVAEKK
jgi:SAM-dependent methyltransferase